MVLSDGSYKQRIKRLNLEVKNKTTKPCSLKGLVKVQNALKKALVSRFLRFLFSCSGFLQESAKKRFMLNGERGAIKMNNRLGLEGRLILLKSELAEKLQKKHVLELEITKQFQELKNLEISLEKENRMAWIEV